MQYQSMTATITPPAMIRLRRRALCFCSFVSTRAAFLFLPAALCRSADAERVRNLAPVCLRAVWRLPSAACLLLSAVCLLLSAVCLTFSLSSLPVPVRIIPVPVRSLPLPVRGLLFPQRKRSSGPLLFSPRSFRLTPHSPRGRGILRTRLFFSTSYFIHYTYIPITARRPLQPELPCSLCSVTALPRTL